jgi:Mrp family chromosome partitioning ATPase
VPAETRLGGGPLVGAPSAPSPEFQDAFQKLASALLQGDQRVFTVSSAQAGEGKTIITGNLGVALATGGRRVLLIDACEQRRPLLQLFGFRPRKGLAELLRNEASIEEVVRPSMTAGLSLLGYGLSGTSWGGWPMLLAELRNRFDVIVLDTAPILDSAKVAPVHRTADYVLFVAAAGSASKSELREAVKLLRKSGGTLEHFVINQLRLP